METDGCLRSGFALPPAPQLIAWYVGQSDFFRAEPSMLTTGQTTSGPLDSTVDLSQPAVFFLPAVRSMKLKSVTIQRFRNFYNAQRFTVEDDVTVLIGKNESGKTTILRALHRLNPANADRHEFDVTLEYPRWRLARDRRKEDLELIRPIEAEFSLESTDISALAKVAKHSIPQDAKARFSRDYANDKHCAIFASDASVIRMAATIAQLSAEDTENLLSRENVEAARLWAAQHATALSAAGETVSSAFTKAAEILKSSAALAGSGLSGESVDAKLWELCPKFFYFSSYDSLPGEVDLTDLAKKVAAAQDLQAGESTMLALLKYAGEEPSDFLEEDYDSRKAELQAASGDLSRRVFEYWKQNTDLEVTFDTDMPVVGRDKNGIDVRHRILKVELRDARHGGVETNFATRSTGFQWFFSFFAAFSEYQESEDRLVVLLDEPGTSLHGDAQRDFVRFVGKELGGAKQTIYTTHSQHMIDPSQYEKLRTVDDRATRENPDLGVIVGPVSLSADRNTLLPIESAIGYSISQHLFLGGGAHLAVEGSSDFVYLQRLTEHLTSKGKTGLDPRLAIVPVGGAPNMPAFVALLGRRLRVSALVDGKKSGTTYERLKDAATANGLSEKSIVLCSSVKGVPTNADVEDLFDVSDYLRLFNWAFDSNLSVEKLPPTNEPILKRIEALHGSFDHALPAHTLTTRRIEFFSNVADTTVSRFCELFDLLNASVDERP